LDSESEIEQQACKFEHILSPEATDKICAFLGHPRTCPHGAPIPPGPCCGRTAELAGVSRFENGPNNLNRMITRKPCIGVFDSGFGGLTVLKALLEVIPEADYLYFGDTAPASLRIEIRRNGRQSMPLRLRTFWNSAALNYCDCLQHGDCAGVG